ncbi:MAG TPA: hypothetical protein VKG91_01900 [Roseiarcus sp.]|nr:hypothetical protein [Roseiarcus sp.]
MSAAEREPGAPLEVTAGLGKDAGQKVVNQLAALERLKPDDAIVTFIDADALPTPLWLARLVAVLINSGKPLATGYRWMTPADDRWSSSCLAAANNSIASLPRCALPLTIVWGGSVGPEARDAGGDPAQGLLAGRDERRFANGGSAQASETARPCAAPGSAADARVLLLARIFRLRRPAIPLRLDPSAVQFCDCRAH